MGVFKKGGDWWIDYRIGGRTGKRKREKIGRSKRLARIVLEKRKVEIAEDKFLDRRLVDKTLLKDFVEKFLEVHSSGKRTKARDEYMLGLFRERWPGRLLSQITPQMIETWRAERARQVAPGTVNRELACLKTLLAKAVEWGKLEANPARTVKPFKVNNQRKRWITQAEFERLYGACLPSIKPVVLVARHTGLRRGEILALRWGDVDFSTRTLYVRDSKNGEAREVPMNRAVEGALRALPRRIRDDKVFGIKNVQKPFRAACEAAELKDFRFHDLRHTFASHLVMSGVDLNTVRDLLGHKTLVMTLRYAHLSPGHRRQAVEALDGYVDTPVDTEAEGQGEKAG